MEEVGYRGFEKNQWLKTSMNIKIASQKENRKRACLDFTPTSKGYICNIKKSGKVKETTWKYRKTCWVCGEEIVKGDRYMGNSYTKICIICAPYFVKNTIKVFENIIEDMKSPLEEMRKNKNIWKEDMLLNRIGE